MPEELSAILKEISTTDATILVRKEQLGELCFEDDVPLFKRCIALAKVASSLQEPDLIHPPFGWSDQYGRNNPLQFAQMINNGLNAVKGFRANQGNPVEAKRHIREQIENGFGGLVLFLEPVLIMKALDASLTFSAKEITHSAAAEAIQTIDTRLANERSRLEKAVEEAEQGVSSIKSMGQGMEKTLLAAQKAASEVGVATNFVHFREEASNHNRMSKFWLSATIGLSLTTLMFAGWSLYYGVCSTADISVSHCLQVAIPKLVILSILYAASVWAGRIYKAHRHNYVVNRHRQNALSSFEAFVQAALDDATKNAVLLEATRSIFSQQPSGYMTKEPEPTGGSTQILEVIKGVLPGNH